MFNKFGGTLKKSRNVPFLPELALWLAAWLSCCSPWDEKRIYQILEDDRTRVRPLEVLTTSTALHSTALASAVKWARLALRVKVGAPSPANQLGSDGCLCCCLASLTDARDADPLPEGPVPPLGLT